MSHLPVMPTETTSALGLKPGARVLDCTFGGGGHSRLALEAYGGIFVAALDRDPAARGRGEQLAAEFPGRFRLEIRNFDSVGDMPAEEAFDAAMMDLGYSSIQMDDPARGFSFNKEARPDMRLDTSEGVAAWELLESGSEEELVRAVRDYGEERHWRRVVGAIQSARGRGLLQSTTGLAELVANAVPQSKADRGRIHPATRTFQGLRIFVNDELGALGRALPVVFEKLKPGGRLAVITFHSLEDRVVKRFFNRMAGRPEHGRDATPQDAREVLARLPHRKPLRPTSEEAASNPRSRSAKLRTLEKL